VVSYRSCNLHVDAGHQRNITYIFLYFAVTVVISVIGAISTPVIIYQLCPPVENVSNALIHGSRAVR
jgi:hypothetical protein